MPCDFWCYLASPSLFCSSTSFEHEPVASFKGAFVARGVLLDPGISPGQVVQANLSVGLQLVSHMCQEGTKSSGPFPSSSRTLAMPEEHLAALPRQWALLQPH